MLTLGLLKAGRGVCGPTIHILLYCPDFTCVWLIVCKAIHVKISQYKSEAFIQLH